MSECEHTLHPVDEQGEPTGTWMLEDGGGSLRVICRVCLKFYGNIDSRESKEADLRKAYLEQQRRLSCPGCGEEPFLS